MVRPDNTSKERMGETVAVVAPTQPARLGQAAVLGLATLLAIATAQGHFGVATPQFSGGPSSPVNTRWQVLASHTRLAYSEALRLVYGVHLLYRITQSRQTDPAPPTPMASAPVIAPAPAGKLTPVCEKLSAAHGPNTARRGA